MKACRSILVPAFLASLSACLVAASCAGGRGEAPAVSVTNRYLECFEIVWQTVNDRFFDPSFGGVDWKGAHARYRPLVEAAGSDKAFYETVNRMLFELNVSHIGVVPADEKGQLEPLASAGGSVGVGLRLLDGAAVITSVLPGSPGERIGLRPGFIVQSVGGKTVAQLADEVERIPPLHERNERKHVTGRVLEQLYGEPGTPVTIVYTDADEGTHEARVRMAPREGKAAPDRRLPPFYIEFESRRLEDIGYIRFNAFLPPVHERFAEALGSFRDARGLIVDLRGNHGGMFFVRKSVIDHLVPERRLFWRFKGRSSTRDVLAEPAKDVYRGPLVVLVDVMSASSAEEVAGGLRSIGRATVVGERTAGIDVVMEAVELPNGATFVFPVEQTRTADGTVLEGRGVIPDVEVKLDRARLLRGIDAQLEAAIERIAARSAAESIIAKCAEAMGGAAGIRDVRTVRLEIVYPDHDPAPVITEIRLPDHIRSERPGEYVASFDGKTPVYLRHDPSKPGQPPVPQELPAEAARGFEIDLIWFFPAFFEFPTEYAGIVEWNGTKCHKLIASLPLGTRAEYLVDARTHLVRAIAADEAYQGKTYRMEREWLDLEPVEGILYPRRMTYPGRGGKQATAEVLKVEFDRTEE